MARKTLNRLYKRFVIRKYVMASSARDAINREKFIKPDDVWLDDDWKREHPEETASRPIGYKTKTK